MRICVAGERRHVSKTVAALLVRRLIYEWASRTEIKKRAIQPLTLTKIAAIPKRYIPEKMPPREVPGCFFEEPRSVRWRIEHRTVTFMSEPCQP